MPVLLNKNEASVYSPFDVDSLVTEVKERLCIKSRERYCSSRRKAPYYVNYRSSKSFECCHSKHWKHYTSPDSRNESYAKQSTCCSQSKGNQSSQPVCDKEMDNPHDLLQKLLTENSLIHEAVRRLQSQAAFASTCSTRKFQPFSNEDSPSNPSFHPFLSEDSCDQSCNLTPFYTESEDDSVSEHSVDL